MDQQSITHLKHSSVRILCFFSLIFSTLFYTQAYAIADSHTDDKKNVHPHTPAVETTVFILPPNHEIQYALEKYDTDVGTLKNTLNYEDGVILYSSVATAKGMAALFLSTDPKELATLSWPENNAGFTPKSLSYHYIHEKNHKKNQQMIFSYNDKDDTHIEGSYKFKAYTLNTDKTIWNRAFLPYLMSSDLMLDPKRTENSFYITNKGRIQKYTYTWQANEMLNFANKVVPVLKFKLIQEAKDRHTFVWLSKAHYYLPLKIEQYKDGRLNARMMLTQLKLH